MVRSYKIHTDLDGSDNTVFDMNNGKIRFYQPSDLGITTTTNIWKSDGIGIFGNSQVNHPQLDFKLETFGDNLEENYKIFNEFINSILAKKFVTLEYTTSLGTYYADVKLSKVTKTEAYGFNGTFSEKISFDTITAWYTYQQLKFSKFENGEFNDNTKIYGNQKYEEDLNLITTQMIKDTTLVHPSFNSMPMVEVPVTNGETYTVSTNQPWENNEAHVWYTRVVSTQPVSGINGAYDGKSITLPAISDKIYIVFRDKNFLNRFINGQYWIRVSKVSGRERYVYTNKSYTYATEENIDRFSKWLIEENIFSFVARLTPSKNVENKKYGLRFLNVDANEYSAIVFNLPQAADVIQINTDSNDEYYQAIFNGQAINMFSALDFQRFRTRLFEKGSMELIGLDSVEMNVKRKVDFV
ncbi:phage distal tail protein domain-containing protein [Lactococcus paracarnosus]|uniref:phage distal tail protein domain-containing protein n=1 Tax=Pseudolactococcus paracarnosus TaxID=2749962 RepID=UPI001FBAA320|nr:phage distal tail protein domain-containing protein [Lactococcus paracarnosus]MCJ1998485.1 hypothetical protein [Lactococcus paracarnosus]